MIVANLLAHFRRDTRVSAAPVGDERFPRLLERKEENGRLWSPALTAARRYPTLSAGLVVAGCALVLQLAILLFHSWRQYKQFDLSLDFAIFHQAWFQIAHGHLDPLLTSNPALVHPAPYWRSHFELIMWPLSLLYWLWPNDGVTLLFIQDVAIVASEIVAIWWLLHLGRVRHLPQWLLAAVIVATAVLGAANPWLYSAAQQDFHFEAVATCFALVAAYELWAGRFRWCWAFAALTLTCGDVAGTYLVGVGLAFAVTTPRVRRQALYLAGVGSAWVVLIAALGANQGSQINSYSYLASHPLTGGAGSLAALAHGLIAHPSRPPARLLASRRDIVRLIQPSGYIGVVSPWMWAPILLVLIENVLNQAESFRLPEFQNFPVFLLATSGTGLLLLLIADPSRRRQAVACVAGVAVLVSSLSFDIGRHEFGVFPSSVEAGSELRAVRGRVPAGAEVISSFGVMGRFAGRRSVHTFISGGNTVPIDEPVVVVVLAPVIGNEPTPPQVVDGLRALIVQRYHARPIWLGAYVSAYEWRPTPQQRSIQIPS